MLAFRTLVACSCVATLSLLGDTIAAAGPMSAGEFDPTASETILEQAGEPTAQLLVNPPGVLIDLPGDGAGTSSAWSIANIGTSPVSITLSQSGSFFSQSPTSFTLAAGAAQRITVSAPDRSAGELLEGSSTISAPGLAAPIVVPVKLVSFAPPASGSAVGEAEENRVDLSAPVEQNVVTGSVAFRNTGSATLTGVLASDAPWLTPQSGLITIPPAGRQVVSFSIDRSMQPTGSAFGSAAAAISLVYPAGAPANSSAPLAAETGSSVVQVIDTKPPATEPATAVPKLTQSEFGYVISGVGNVRGAFDSLFLSDLNLLNEGSSPSDLRIYYVPSGGGSVTEATATAGGSAGIALADVVSSVFGGTDQIGTLHLRSQSIGGFAVSAHVFNKANARGTYGTSLPVFRTNHGAGKGEALEIVGLRQEPGRYRTNLYLQEAGGWTTTAQVRYFDEAGAELGTALLAFAPYTLATVPSEQIPQGTVRVQVRNINRGNITGFATPTDNSSNDTWAVTDWVKYFGVIVSNATIFVPGVGNLRGRNDTFFRSDLTLGNPTGSAVDVRLEYVSSDGSRTERVVTLDAGTTQTLTDVIGTTFGMPGTGGYLRVIPGGARMTARTYTTVGSDPATFGTGLPMVPINRALSSGSRRIAGLEDSKSEIVTRRTPATYRANLGLIETAGMPVTVRIAIYFETGSSLAVSAGDAPPRSSIEVTLAANESRQLNGILTSVLGPEWETSLPSLRNLQVEISIADGPGAVLPYVTLTDNGTADTVLRIE